MRRWNFKDSSRIIAGTTYLFPRRSQYNSNAPLPGSMHQPGESGMEAGSSVGVEGKETWAQFSAKMRHGRRRIKVIDIASKMTYEYQMLKKMCKKRPAMRQWTVRDDFCNMDPGVVVMSPSMQAAFMKVFRLKDKGLIRQCLRNIIPIIEYRNREEKPPSFHKSAADMIPEGEPDTLNQKKRELFERKEVSENFAPLHLHDHRSQAKLRFKIRQRLIKFQRQIAVANAVANRSILYSSDDAIGYLLFRGPAMYSAMHRVFFELSKLMPHFTPKTMLDFGTGTGTAILVAKEVYDPGTLAYPLYRSLRQTMQNNDASQEHQLSELRYDLKRLERNNVEKKRARFMAVASLIERGEVNLLDLPEDLRKEIVEVAANAAASKKRRVAQEKHARHHDVVDGTEWEDGDPLGERLAKEEDPLDTLEGEDDSMNDSGVGESKESASQRTWWEKYVDMESENAAVRAHRRLKPLQEITAIEPSPGMMEIGTMVLTDDVPNITWKRYLLPEDETIQHDLVVAAYSLSEVAESTNRKKLVQQLWKMTSGVLVLVEYANISNFNILMEARDTILEEKDVGLWDWQPTIIAPCPHEGKCPIRHCKEGVKRKAMRVCSTETYYRSTFVESWARHLPLKVSVEPISYLIFARNELVPERAERRKKQKEEEELQKQKARDEKQTELYRASLSLKDVVFERLSEEALHRPSSDVPTKLPSIWNNSTPEADKEGSLNLLGKDLSTISNAVESGGSAEASDLGRLPSDKPRIVRTSNTRFNKLIYPTQYPPATHRYNRAFIDAGFQRQRAITPSEMLVVRQEMNDIRRRIETVAPKYLRIVRDPSCHGKIQSDFCTPEGDLITGRVYRRFYGDKNRVSNHSTLRWQHVGGWKLLKRVRRGSLFPHDVPIYTVTTHPQIDFPNTLLNVKYSTVEKTAMQYNDPQTLMDTPEEELTRPERIAKRKLQRDVEMQQKAEEQIENILGRKISDKEILNRVDARREISVQEWAEAVRRAKIKTIVQTKKTIPNAAKIRAAKRSLQFRKRSMGREMADNRKR